MAYPEAHHYLRDLQELNGMLDLARDIGSPEAAQVLLAVDALPVGRDDTSSQLLARAVHLYVGGCVSLYEVVGPQAREYGLCSLLHLAVTRGYTGVVRLLLEWGADPNESNELQRSPLHMAVARGDRSVAFMLLQCGADPRAVHISGKTALHFSCEGADDEWLVGRLLDLGLGINDVDRLHRNTPLHLAVKNGNLSVAALLIQRGADLTVRNTEGSTPVHLAAPRTRILKLLLQRGVDLKCTDARGRTLLQLIDFRQTEAARTVIKYLVMEEAVTGIPMDKANADCVEREPFWRYIRDECLANVARMKKIKCSRGITFFKILSMSVKDLAKRVRGRHRLALLMEPLLLDERFNYAEELHIKIAKVLQAREHAHRVRQFLNRTLGDCLPLEVTTKIGEFLQPKDIRFK